MIKRHQILVLLALHCSVAFSQEINPDYALLWEVSKPGQQPSYVFGSLHSNDRRLFNMPDSVYYAMDRAEAIILEVDVFSIFEMLDTRNEEANLNFDREGRPYTNNNFASRTSYGDEDGMPQFLDAYFQQYCYNAGKKFESLESVEFQMELVSEMAPEGTMIDFDLQSLMTSKEDMIELYLDGDINELSSFVKSGLSLYPELYESLIISRNIGMTDVIDSLIQEQPLFCAIGAGHLSGPAGVLNLLRSKGYKVRKVLGTYSESPQEFELRVNSFREYVVKEELSGLRISFPGKPLEIENEFDDPFLKKWVYCDLGQGNSYQVELYERRSLESWEDVAAEFIPSPEESPAEKIELPNGGEAIQGLGQEYWDNSMTWIRVIMTEDYIVVLKADGGNKFMNSPRAFRFFDKVTMD